MSKILKILIIFTIMVNIFIYTSNAETTNLYNDISDETNSTNTSETDENVVDDEEIEDENVTEEENTTSYTPSTANARVSTVSSIPEANLGLNNILCIILIAIGILIILLAIAILVRIKN